MLTFCLCNNYLQPFFVSSHSSYSPSIFDNLLTFSVVPHCRGHTLPFSDQVQIVRWSQQNLSSFYSFQIFFFLWILLHVVDCCLGAGCFIFKKPLMSGGFFLSSNFEIQIHFSFSYSKTKVPLLMTFMHGMQLAMFHLELNKNNAVTDFFLCLSRQFL